MLLNLGRVLHIAAAGALVLGLGAFNQIGAEARQAQAVPGTFVSEIVVSNKPGNPAATVSLTFMKSDGSLAMAAAQTFTVQSGASVATYVPNIAGLADGRYSVVVDSDQDVSAIANLTSLGPVTSTAYNGISSNDSGTKFYIPQTFKNYVNTYTSSLVVQNAGSAGATVRIGYLNQAGTEITNETRAIASGASSTFDQGSTSLPDGYIGSAVVTSDQPVAAIFLVSFASGGKNALSSGRGLKAGSGVVFLPSIFDDYHNFRTSVLVQNVGATATNVTVEYYDARNGVKLGEERTTSAIAPGTSRQFLQFDPGSRPAVVPVGLSAAAVVRATDAGGSVVAVGNITEKVQQYLEAYNGFPDTAATTKATCATIMKNYHGYNTSLSVQNADSAAVSLQINYTNADGSVAATDDVGSLAPGAVFSTYNPNKAALPNGFKGGAIVTATGGKIVALVNEQLGAGDQPGDVLFTYACSNV